MMVPEVIQRTRMVRRVGALRKRVDQKGVEYVSVSALGFWGTANSSPCAQNTSTPRAYHAQQCVRLSFAPSRVAIICLPQAGSGSGTCTSARGSVSAPGPAPSSAPSAMGASSQAPPVNALVVIRPHGARAAIGVVDLSDLGPVWGQPCRARILVSARGSMEDLGLMYHQDSVQSNRAAAKAAVWRPGVPTFLQYHMRLEDIAVISAAGAPAIGGLVRRRDVSMDWAGVVIDVETH